MPHHRTANPFRLFCVWRPANYICRKIIQKTVQNLQRIIPSLQNGFGPAAEQQWRRQMQVIHLNPFFVVITKPGSLLSVPDQGEEIQDCVVNRIKAFFSGYIDQPCALPASPPLQKARRLSPWMNKKRADNTCRP